MDEHSHSKENPTTMNQPSHENPTAIIEPSDENPTAIIEPSDENPTAIIEPSDENPTAIIEPSDENPTAIIEPSDENPAAIIEPPENPPTMNEPSDENPAAIIEPPVNPPTIPVPSPENQARTFSFELKPASTLRKALLALCDLHLNPEGLARINVVAKGLQITVLNATTKVMGCLRLSATGLMNFQFSEPLDSQIINLCKMMVIFLDNTVADDDTVTIYHLVGSTQLSFTFDSSPARVISVDLHGKDTDFGHFLGGVKKFCEARFHSGLLRYMIAKINSEQEQPSLDPEKEVPLTLEQRTLPYLVSMDFTQKILDISVSKGHWKHKFDIPLQEGRMKPEERHASWFEWTHWDSLKKASALSKWFQVSITSDPPDSIMMEFNLGQLGNMMYVRRACNSLNDHKTFGLHVVSSS